LITLRQPPPVRVNCGGTPDSNVIYRFEDIELDTQRLELRVDGVEESLEPQVFSVLAYLVEHRDRVVSKDEVLEEVWKTAYVSDSALASRIMAARRAVGDDGRSQRLIRTVQRRGYRFVGEVEEAGDASSTVEGDAHSARPSVDEAIEPLATDDPAAAEDDFGSTSVQFCTTPDGVRIAFAVGGSGPPLVKVANWLTHLEFDLESPIWRHTFSRLAADHQFIRYDARGSGLSDWDVEELTLDAWVRDLEAVVDELGLDDFPMLGISQGAAIAIRYVVRNPGRVKCLILQGGYARGRRERGEAGVRLAETLEMLAEREWGHAESAFSRLFSDRMIPGGTAEQQGWLTDLQRVSTSAENALGFMLGTGAINVTDDLPNVDVPTLVLHSRREEQVPFEEGRIIAAGIPNARLVPLDSRNHLILEDEPAWPVYQAEVTRFLAEHDA
jgi:DNA-binding winged helix-turn-helix (wHTH) protein/pimeloyl-ACP methyl ester carboxylesterase